MMSAIELPARWAGILDDGTEVNSGADPFVVDGIFLRYERVANQMHVAAYQVVSVHADGTVALTFLGREPYDGVL
jgi:hypothetical protein